MKKIISFIICIAILGIILVSVFINSKNKKDSIKIIIKTPPLIITNLEDGDEITDAYQLLKKVADDFKKQYTDENVEIEIVNFSYVDEGEYITECFDTENATDILLEGYFNMSSYIYTGRVVSLDDIVSDELKEDFYENDLEMSKINNKTYMLPYYGLYNTLAYNKEIFKKCGLEKYIGKDNSIQHWTLEDWDIILSTLKEKMPEMTYPMMMYAKNNQGDTHIMTLLRQFGCELFDENRHFNVNTPEGIKALQYIKDCYDKGYYPIKCENMELRECITLFENDQIAICMTNNASIIDYDLDKIGLVNFPSEDGNGYFTNFMTGFMIFDNGDKTKIKVAKDFLKFFYSNEEYLKYERVAIPANKSVVKNSEELIPLLNKYTQNVGSSVDFTANNPNWQGKPNSVRNVFWPHIHALLSGKETAKQAAEGIDKDCNLAIKEGYDDGKLHE